MSEDTPQITPQQKYNRRIDIWRRTALLFHTVRKKTGVFRKCGYNKYVVEGKLTSRSRETQYNPDIIAWARRPDKLLIVEVTTDPTSYERKQQQIYNYQHDSNYSDAKSYGAPNVSSADVIISHPYFYSQKPSACEIAFSDGFKVRNTEKLIDSKLTEALNSSSAEDIPNHAPDIGISIIPEMTPEEIRIGLSAYIFSIFKPGDNGKTVVELTDLCLERYSDKVAVSEKRKLEEKVRTELMELVRTAREYISYNQNTKKICPTEKGTKIPTNYKSKQAFKSKLDDWMGISQQTQLTRWIPDIDDNPDDESVSEESSVTVSNDNIEGENT